jgi:uncharacterized protein
MSAHASMTADSGSAPMSLLEWRRTVGDLYGDIRATPDKHVAWQQWRQTRAHLFREHPESPLPPEGRAGYSGPHVYPYDPAWRLVASVEPVTPASLEIATSTTEVMAFSRFGQVSFAYAGTAMSLELYWLTGYGGGLFLPFADATSGTETYGAGRYLLDTVKGADLGQEEGRLVLDFNFAYFPSCAYDPRWTCPLAPPANRLSVAVRAGERLTVTAATG